MAGVGKSTLAVQVAHTVASSFPEGQLYADLRAPDGAPRNPRTVLSELLRALGDSAENLAGAALPAYVQRYRARTAGKALLVILDNLVEERQLDPLLPGGTGSAVVVTARTHPAAVSGIRTVVLEPLRPGESLTLLGAMAGASRLAREPEAARDLVAYCEGLPLALRAVGARLAARPRLPLSWLADRLAEPEARLGELRYGELSVAASLAHSLHDLDDTAVAVLRSLPALGLRPFTAAEAAGRAGSAEPASFEQALDRLADARLLDLSAIDDQGQPLYRCPGLVQLFARSLEAPASGQTQAGAGAPDQAQAPTVTGTPGVAHTPALATAPGKAHTPALATAPGKAHTPALTTAPGQAHTPALTTAPGQAHTPALTTAPGQAHTPALTTAPGQAHTPALTTAPGQAHTPALTTAPGQAHTPALTTAPGQAHTPALATAPGQAHTPVVTGAPGAA
ncbi:NB-ARC domain-containing protein [Streptomyces cynarae]|uniref:NB-ARC domain-containing protein n=1 Tax=Streptomyces cynarae TaxID=2981134 RepID=A0ABY6E243_9ACTN|nr:NB-ARC domain-containing protein [Streptomyces cynarae]UXY19871.1 NB-ARC domain-containing protein [Streptomyces cynarae]